MDHKPANINIGSHLHTPSIQLGSHRSSSSAPKGQMSGETKRTVRAPSPSSASKPSAPSALRGRTEAEKASRKVAFGGAQFSDKTASKSLNRFDAATPRSTPAASSVGPGHTEAKESAFSKNDWYNGWTAAVRHHQASQLTPLLSQLAAQTPADQADLARRLVQRGSATDLSLFLRVQASKGPGFLQTEVTLTVGQGKKSEDKTDTIQNHLLDAAVRSGNPEKFDAVLRGIQQADYASKTKRQQLTSGIKNLAHRVNYQAGQLRNTLIDKKVLPAGTDKANLDPQRMSPAVARALYQTEGSSNRWLALAGSQETPASDMIKTLAQAGAPQEEAACRLLALGDLESAQEVMPTLKDDASKIEFLKNLETKAKELGLSPVGKITAWGALVETVSLESLKQLPEADKATILKIGVSDGSWKDFAKLLSAGAPIDTKNAYGETIKSRCVASLGGKAPALDVEDRKEGLAFLKQQGFLRKGELQALSNFSSGLLLPADYSAKNMKYNLELVTYALEQDLIDTSQATWKDPLAALYAKNVFYVTEVSKKDISVLEAEKTIAKERYEQGTPSTDGSRVNFLDKQDELGGLKYAGTLAQDQQRTIAGWIRAVGDPKLDVAVKLADAIAEGNQEDFDTALNDMKRNGHTLEGSLMKAIDTFLKSQGQSDVAASMMRKLQEY